MRKVKEALVLLTAILIALSACATGNNGEAGSDGESINDFIPGFEVFDPDAGPEDFAAEEQQVQDLVQTCMAEQGFEYVPYVPNQEEFFRGGDPEDYVAEFGFGIATEILQQPNFEEGETPHGIEDDPNYAIQQEMSPDEQEAYFAALYGEQPDLDFESMTEDEINEFFEGFDPGGCQNDAQKEVYNFDGGASQAFFQEFGDDLEEIYQRVQADPRIAKQEVKWSSCMKEAGYDFAEQNDAQIYILRRLEEVGAIGDLEIDPSGQGWGYGSEGVEEGSDTYKAVEAIAEEEITLAKKSLECGAQDQELFQEIYEEYEQEFIEQNREALERFKADNS